MKGPGTERTWGRQGNIQIFPKGKGSRVHLKKISGRTRKKKETYLELTPAKGHLLVQSCIVTY